MQTNSISVVPSLGVDGNLFGNSAVDVSLYVQLLLVKEYDDQLKDFAGELKIGNKLKEAYRKQKQAVQELLAKPKDKDGKVELNGEERTLLESKPTYFWNKNLYEGQGGIRVTYQQTPFTTYQSEYQPTTFSSNAAPFETNREAFVWGDPHFVDPDGGTFDFQGENGEFYNYLRDTNLEVNVQHAGVGENVTVIGATQVLLYTPEQAFDIRANGGGSVTLNGAVLAANDYKTLEENQLSLEGNTLTITTPEYTIAQKLNGSSIDMKVYSTGKGVTSDGVAPTGAVGDQFDGRPAKETPEEVMRAKYRIPEFAPIDNSTRKVEKEKIEAEMERLNMEIDNLNGNSELISLNLQNLTNQRKVAFETVSNILSKSSEAASNIVRNIGR